MAYLIGTDEAGYGPNLGPLVVSATAWEVPDEGVGSLFPPNDCRTGERLPERDSRPPRAATARKSPAGTGPGDLFTLLESAIAPSPGDARDGRVAIGDSKALYKPGAGLRWLECALLGALGVLDRAPADWRGAWDALDPAAQPTLASVPWYAGYQAALPVDARPADIKTATARLRDGLAGAGVRLVDVRSRAVFPEEFNRLCDRHGTKGAALSHVTLALAADLVRPLPSGPISVVCDKHGGRNRYADLLAQHFPDHFIEIRGESRARSVYRFGPPQRRIEFRFQTKGESYLQAALASMASKYLRELAMQAFNAFWCSHVAGLTPTAGYPQDAKRFRAAIAEVQVGLEIDNEVLWRRR